ncbi:MAG: hypothetical protein KJI72_02675 [Patescibacteria group bacterium]|nr:hypothetical protein [Patescibacteria group bacterium]
MPETKSPTIPTTPPSPNNLKEQFVSEAIPVGLPWRLLIFSLILFGFSLFVFFGLRFGYNSYIDTRTGDLDEKIGNLSGQVSQEEQQSFINFYSQLVNLKKVLDRHDFTASIFSFLEKNTLGKISYIDADFTVLDSSLTLKGAAASSESLINQLTLFDESLEVDRVVLNQMNSSKDGVTFGVTLFFNPDFFKKPAL